MSITPQMQMELPTVGVTSGTAGNNMYVAAFNVVDNHDHTSGKGTQVPTAGININSSLSFNSYSGTSFRSVQFASQGVAFSDNADNLSCYVVGSDLYFRDGAGNNVQLTSSGSVAGTSGSIGGLSSPASATFSTNIFIWKSAATTFAKMRNADIELYPATAAAANAITIKAPTLAGSYTLTLPSALPASNRFLQMDTSGNVTAETGDVIGAAMTSVGSNAISAVRTRATGTSVAAGGVAKSNSSGSFSTTSTSFVDVTNLSVTIVTSGRPVHLVLVSDGATLVSYVQAFNSSGTSSVARFRFVRDATNLDELQLNAQAVGATTSGTGVPPGAISFIDFPGSGTYVYKLQGKVATSGQCIVENVKLVAYEL